jgi:hypothetical protein
MYTPLKAYEKSDKASNCYAAFNSPNSKLSPLLMDHRHLLTLTLIENAQKDNVFAISLLWLLTLASSPIIKIEDREDKEESHKYKKSAANYVIDSSVAKTLRLVLLN